MGDGTAGGLSVVVPTCGRPEGLACCLARLEGVAEVVVTDDGPLEEGREVVARYPWARWVRGPRRGPAANRNHGARQVRGAWVGFIDDDCVPGAGWVEAAAAAVARGEADVVEGRTECPGARDTPFEEHVENLSGGVLWSCNMVVRREVFERLGGFDEAFLEAAGEDMEFAWRLRASGARIVFEPALAVEHPPRRIGWRHLWRRLWRTRWGVLYHVKTTGRGGVLLGEPVDLLRCTAQLITRFDGARWRTRLFGIAWRWATFPLVYPYLIYWSWRYRRMGGRGDGG